MKIDCKRKFVRMSSNTLILRSQNTSEPLAVIIDAEAP